MASGVGSILREARNRRKVDIPTVEAATRIRVRFLRAIENEEWDVLPGGVYTRGFIRTYAAYLGLDGERLAEQFRHEVEGSGAERGPTAELAPVAASAATGTSGGRRSLPSAGWIAIAAVVFVAVLVIVVLPGGGGGREGGSGKAHRNGNVAGVHHEKMKPAAKRDGVSVRLSANAEVWVCMLDARGEHLVDGQILEAGANEGPFRSDSFTVSFGNGEVSMQIDGKEAEIPLTSSPVGFSIDASGALTELDEAERPTCT
ncbi:MAG: helix-turn-helix domain-containing protein [Solirubrobacterales bacterium]